MFIKAVISMIGLFVFFVSPAWCMDKDKVQQQHRQQEMLQDRERVQEHAEERSRLQQEQRIFGWQIMTPVERQVHRQNMLRLKTHKEREAYRKEHHERMLKRAEEMGVKLQEMPE